MFTTNSDRDIKADLPTERHKTGHSVNKRKWQNEIRDGRRGRGTDRQTDRVTD